MKGQITEKQKHFKNASICSHIVFANQNPRRRDLNVLYSEDTLCVRFDFEQSLKVNVIIIITPYLYPMGNSKAHTNKISKHSHDNHIMYCM